MGKTAFSLNLVQNAALKGDASVAVFSLEMSKEQLVQRMLSAQSNVELSKLKTGKLNEKTNSTEPVSPCLFFAIIISPIFFLSE